MASLFTKIAMATIVAAGTLAASTPTRAAGIDVDIRVVRPNYRVHNPRVMILPADRLVIRRYPAAGRCNPNQALNKAFNNGLNRPSIANITPRRVTVKGKIRGMWAKVSYANVRGCPRA